MTTITDEQGLLNNFAREPQMYYANTPSPQEKRNYLGWGAIALVFVAVSIFTAVSVS